MTVRANKLLLLIATALVVIAGGLNAFQAFRPGGDGWRDMTDVLPFVAFTALLGSMWWRLRKLEAEHGPDYAPPSSPHAKKILAIVVLVAAALAAVAAVLVAQGR